MLCSTTEMILPFEFQIIQHPCREELQNTDLLFSINLLCMHVYFCCLASQKLYFKASVSAYTPVTFLATVSLMEKLLQLMQFGS